MITQAEEAIKAELAAEGKPEKSGIKSSQVNGSFLHDIKLTNTRFLHKFIMDDSKTVGSIS